MSNQTSDKQYTNSQEHNTSFSRMLFTMAVSLCTSRIGKKTNSAIPLYTNTSEVVECIYGFGIERFLQSLHAIFKVVDVYRRSRLIRRDCVRRNSGIPRTVRLFEPDNGVVLVHQQNRAVRSEPERLCAISSVHAGNLTCKALHRSCAVLWACRGIS